MEGRREWLQAGEKRLQAYLDGVAAALGHAGRAGPARDYCTGLLLPGQRKSIEPMAARIRPNRVGASHQAMHHVVAKAEWNDAAVLRAVRERVLPAIERHGPVCFWRLDGLTFPKQGSHSVGVARQPGDRPGKPDHCQVAVMLSVANEHASLPIAYRLYLPQDWAEDPARRSKAGVPDEIRFETEAAIALGQVRQALAERVPVGVVLGSARFGGDAEFRAAISDLGLLYALGIQLSASLQPSGTAPCERGCEPPTAKALALELPMQEWRSVGWHEKGRTALSSRFAAVRVRCPARHEAAAAQGRDEWLLVEWPRRAEPLRCWLLNLPPDTALAVLVQTAKGGRSIERDLQELGRDAGLDHYEGRGWRGFHHHASLCIAAYGFLVAERCLLPPAQRFAPRRMAMPELPWNYRPRGSARAVGAASSDRTPPRKVLRG